jgi:hypothetical protein
VNETYGQTLLDALSSNPEYADFYRLIQATGVEDTLRTNEKNILTLFVPKNGSIDLSEIGNPAKKDSLRMLALMHIVRQPLYRKEMTGIDYHSFSNRFLRFFPKGETVTVNDIAVLTSGFRFSNGVIYQINSPIASRLSLWEKLCSDSRYTRFVDYVNSCMADIFDPELSLSSGVLDASGNMIYTDSVFVNTNVYLHDYPIDNHSFHFTLFAPDNQVVEQILQNDFWAAVGGDPDKITVADTVNFFSRIFTHGLIANKEVTPAYWTPSYLQSVLNSYFNPAASDLTANDQQLLSNGLFASVNKYDEASTQFFFQNKKMVDAYMMQPDSLNLISLPSGWTPTPTVVYTRLTDTLYATVNFATYDAPTTPRCLTVKIPDVRKGSYSVAISFYTQTCQLKIRHQGGVEVAFDPRKYRPLHQRNIEVMTINVTDFGDVYLDFVPTGSGNNGFQFYLRDITLQPVL